MKLDFENQADDVRIELIPLIDVVFCILIFFILASLQLTRQQALSINLPQSSTSALQTRKSLIVSIDSSGTVFLEREPVTQDNLYYAMQGFQQQNPDGLMVLYADRSATYDSVIQLLDKMRAIGGDRVALATQQPQPGNGQPLIPGLTPDGAVIPPGAGLGFPGVPATPGAPIDPFANPGAVDPGLAPGLEGLGLDGQAVPSNPFDPGATAPGGVAPAVDPFNPDDLTFDE